MLDAIAEWIALMLIVLSVALQCSAEFVRVHNPEIVAVASVLLAFVTGGLVWVGYTQIWTTRAQLRAYVDVAPRGVTTLVNKPDVLAHLAFVNRGHLPARKLRAGIKIKWSDNDDLDTLDEVEIGKVSTILRPGTEAEQGTSPVNAAETSNVNAELGFVYVWGKIEYEDGFGKNRWRIFCHRYN